MGKSEDEEAMTYEERERRRAEYEAAAEECDAEYFEYERLRRMKDEGWLDEMMWADIESGGDGSWVLEMERRLNELEDTY